MQLIKEIIHPDFPTPGLEIDTRSAARILLIDSDGNMPLLYTSIYDIYCIPWWGIEPWETVRDATLREAKEETWCEIKVLGEIWKIREKRPAKWYAKWINLEQDSYCSYGKITSVWSPEFTEKEIEKWFELRWIHIDDALDMMEKTSPDNLKAQLVKQRDIVIFKKWYNFLKNV